MFQTSRYRFTFRHFTVLNLNENMNIHQNILTCCINSSCFLCSISLVSHTQNAMQHRCLLMVVYIHWIAWGNRVNERVCRRVCSVIHSVLTTSWGGLEVIHVWRFARRSSGLRQKLRVSCFCGIDWFECTRVWTMSRAWVRQTWQ